MPQCTGGERVKPSDRLASAEIDCVAFSRDLSAASPADGVGEAEEPDVLLSHRRAALTGHESQPLHRATHRSTANRVRDVRPQLLHPFLQERRQGAQGEDGLRKQASYLRVCLQMDSNIYFPHYT